VKLPLREPEHDALLAELARWEGYVSSALLATEAIRACARYSPDHALRAREWLQGLALLPLDDLVLDRSPSLGPAGLRSLDALHLATALGVREDIGAFVVYDQRLAGAAREMGLNVVQPG
jgi:uncharacterized protein